MGSADSKSTVTNETNKTFINRSTYNLINSNTNSAVAKAMITSNQTCVMTNLIDQEINFSGCKITAINKSGQRGKVVYGGTQEAKAVVDFSCISVIKAEQAMAQAMMQELVTDIQSKMDAKTKDEINNKADLEASASALGGDASTDSNVSNKLNVEVVNQNDTHIQNIIKNSIESNFEVKNIQECIVNTSIKQKFDGSKCEIYAEDADIEMGGNQVAGIGGVVKCINESNTVQNVLSDVGNKLGVSIKNDMEATSESKTINDIKASATASLGASCPGCDPSTAGPSSALCSLCCFCCCCCVPLMGMMIPAIMPLLM